MLPTPNNSVEFIIFIYLYFCEIWEKIKTKLLPGKIRGRKSNLRIPEVLTLGCMFVFSGIPTIKRFYEFVTSAWKSWFDFPVYKNFIEGMNKSVGIASICLQHLLKLFRSQFPAHAIDSTPLPVCKVKREYSHKVCKGIAEKSRSTIGWFFGFKLHAIVSKEGYLLSVVITKANVDDRTPIEKLTEDLDNCIIIADAGYISAELREKLLQKGILLFYAVRNNMKKLMTGLQYCLLKSRQIVESVFSVLKDRMFMASSLPRSIVGHLSRYIFCLLGYQLKCLLRSFHLIS